MPTVYTSENFAGRVNYAALVISKQRKTTRSFDTCFEMFDGDAVAAAIWRRSLKNPTLAQNLPQYLTPSRCEECYHRYAGQNLNKVAQALRDAR